VICELCPADELSRLQTARRGRHVRKLAVLEQRNRTQQISPAVRCCPPLGQFSAGLTRVGAIDDAAALRPFKTRAHGYGRENEMSSLCLVAISLIRTISGKIFKTVAFFVSPIPDHYILPTAAFLSFFGTDSTDSPRTVYRFLLYSFCVFSSF